MHLVSEIAFKAKLNFVTTDCTD